jgi:perosamine synthetase
MATQKLIRRKKQIGSGGAIITPQSKKYVQQVLDSGRISQGPFLRKFERMFADLHARKFAVSASSGTAALLVAVQALKELDGWKDGDEVLVPAVTFIATSNVVLQNNLRPVFVDIDPRTYNIDPKKIEEKITPRTRAIMPVHLFGLSADMAPILKLAKKYKLRLIEDSCETVGGTYRGKPVGALGDIACYSTYMAHIITTGVGGLALANDPQIVVKMRSLINHGRDAIYISIDDDKGKRGKALQEMMERRFSFVSVGHSHRMTEIEGALGLGQLQTLSQNLRTRRRIAAALLNGLQPFTQHFQLPAWPAHAEHSFMMFPILVVNEGISRDELTAYLEEWNIETRPIFPLLSQPVYRQLFGDIEHEYPIAQRATARGFYIGCHPEMTNEDVRYILAVFERFFRKA